eukprot:TRINITY_DN1927_c0_g1_i2.p1 TRINITY_DN1927_c0_g1~~TRINITY_DN1927_c0_g1_i2.p1  ORF type:complete len:789 (-),score=437.16 TRINITY_DN1927_c0_g1_i2:14-2380(-)
MQQKGKANEFEDQRIGETDSNLNEDEKALIRYQKEVKKRYSKGMFNLDDEESEQLTHLGANIEDMKSFDDYQGNSSDEEAEDALDKEVVSKLHFGGFEKVGEEEGKEREKSRDEVYAEIIAKSKAAKRERAKGKQEQEELNDKLDLDFADLRDEIAAMKREKLTDEEKKEKGIGKTDYDKNVRELAFEMRAAPSDRTKKPEEIAKEEAEKLEELERQRMKRMNGEEEEENVKGKDGKQRKNQKSAYRSADSLEDDFVPEKEDEGTLAYSINSDDEDAESGAEEGEKSDEGEEEEGEEGEEEEEESEEDEGEDLQDDEQVEEDEGEEEVVEKKESKKKIILKKGSEIPFTFPVPSSHAEFSQWAEDRSGEELNVIITRIRTCNHPSLHPENKKKLEGFSEILLEHFFHLSASISSVDSVPLSQLNVLTKHLFELKEIFGDRLFHLCRDRVLVFQEALSHKLNEEKKSGSCWPSFGHLLFFQLMAKIYPVTDFQHFALTPSIILLNQYLSQCPVKNPKEYSIALFVSNIVLHYIKSSKRFSPEVIRFLNNGIASFNGKSSNIPKGILQFKEKNSQKLKAQPLSLSIFAGTFKEKKEMFSSDQWRMDAFRTTVSLLSQFVHLYEDNNSFEEMTIDVKEELNKIERNNLNKEAKKEVEDLLDFINQTAEKCIRKRKPMKFIVTKPKEIKTLNPKFQEANYGKKKGLDEQTVHKNLQKAVKKQKKGAMRELKKDNAFIQSEKNKKRREEVDEREKKRRKIMASLETQQSELKLSEKMKKKGSKGSNPKGRSAF